MAIGVVSAAGAPVAKRSSTVKSTMPTPSLNNDSPWSCTSSLAGMLTVFNVLITATGSVGLISAPKTRAQISGTGWLESRAIVQNPKPTMAVEMTVPRIARTSTGSACVRSLGTSTWSAPAKIRNASMPSITTALKSIWPRTFPSAAEARCSGSIASRATSTSEATTPITRSPMAWGRSTNLRFSQPNTADRVRRIAQRSRMDIVSRVEIGMSDVGRA